MLLIAQLTYFEIIYVAIDLASDFVSTTLSSMQIAKSISFYVILRTTVTKLPSGIYTVEFNRFTIKLIIPH